MDLSKTLIKEFAKSMIPTKEENTEGSQIRGTIVIRADGKYVQLDGAPEGVITPISEGMDESDGDSFIDGDRVLVLIKDHQVIFSKNLNVTSRTAKNTKENVISVSGDLYGDYLTKIGDTSEEILNDVDVNNAIFIAKFTTGEKEAKEVESGNKLFRYINTDWYLEEEASGTIDIVELNEYGIELPLDYIPTDGDNFTVDLYYKDGLVDEVSNIPGIIDENKNATEEALEKIRDDVAKNDDWVKEYLGDTGYIKIIKDETNPYIEIGKGEDENKLSIKITSNQMTFYQGGSPVAYINDDRLFINNSTVVEEQGIGNFVWVNRNGRLTLKHK